jgi:hypothetical protein
LIADLPAKEEKEVFAKIGALLGVVVVAAFCIEPAGASLKRVIIVDRLDTAAPGLVDVEQGNPTEREAKERQAPDSMAAPNETSSAAE